MARDNAFPSMDTLNLSDPDNDPDDLFASPSHIVDKKPAQAKSTFPRNLDTPKTSTVVPNLDCKETDEAALRRELAGVRKINEVIKGVVDSLERAKGNMETVSRTVSNASTLLNTWTRILSQTEHNQRLILNPTWHGASQDISDMENESVMRRQQKERREAEEAQREEVSARKAEEDERRREEVADGRGSRRITGRGRGVGKRQTGGYVGVGGQSSGRGVARGMARGTKRGGGTTPSMADTGIGRGLSERGRGRGLS